jgi:hypothetical protein
MELLSYMNKCEKRRAWILNTLNAFRQARGSVIGWGTTLQAGRSRDRVPMRWVFSIYLTFQPHYGDGVDSASNRNEYQKSSWGGRVKGGQRVGLTTLPPSMSRLSRLNVGASAYHNLMGLHGLLQRQLYLTLPYLSANRPSLENWEIWVRSVANKTRFGTSYPWILLFPLIPQFSSQYHKNQSWQIRLTDLSSLNNIII